MSRADTSFLKIPSTVALGNLMSVIPMDDWLLIAMVDDDPISVQFSGDDLWLW
jgi:hypothetical protein